MLASDEGVVDQEFGLRRPASLQLFKTSEVYEWRETKSQRRQRISPSQTRVTTEYSYDTRWGSRHRDSNRFEAPSGHYNPLPRYFVGERTYTAKDARLSNGMRVGPELVDQLTASDWLLNLANSAPQLDGGHHHKVPVNLENLHLQSEEKAVVSLNKLYISDSIQTNNQLGSNLLPSRNLSTNEDRRIPIARTLPSPQVGDMRVSWKEVLPPKEGVSVLAKQQGDELVPWSLGGGRHRLYSLLPGRHSAKEMIGQQITKSKFITKALRIGGWLGTFLGLKLILSCIPALLRLAPLGIGQLLAPLAGIATSTIALGVSVGLSGTIIAIAWLRFRPVLSGLIALVSTASFFGPFFYARWNRSAVVQEVDLELIK